MPIDTYWLMGALLHSANALTLKWTLLADHCLIVPTLATLFVSTLSVEASSAGADDRPAPGEARDRHPFPRHSVSA